MLLNKNSVQYSILFSSNEIQRRCLFVSRAGSLRSYWVFQTRAAGLKQLVQFAPDGLVLLSSLLNWLQMVRFSHAAGVKQLVCSFRSQLWSSQLVCSFRSQLRSHQLVCSFEVAPCDWQQLVRSFDWADGPLYKSHGRVKKRVIRENDFFLTFSRRMDRDRKWFLETSLKKNKVRSCSTYLKKEKY